MTNVGKEALVVRRFLCDNDDCPEAQTEKMYPELDNEVFIESKCYDLVQNAPEQTLRQRWASQLLTESENARIWQDRRNLRLMAKKPFSLGDLICEFRGTLIDEVDLKKDCWKRSYINGCFRFCLGDAYNNQNIDPFYLADSVITKYIRRDADTPNSQLKVIEVEERPTVVVVAINRINRNEEIRFDYKIRDDSIPWSLDLKSRAKVRNWSFRLFSKLETCRVENGLEVFRRGESGHSVRTLRTYRKYDFVCEYQGDLMSVLDYNEICQSENYKRFPVHYAFYLQDKYSGMCLNGTEFDSEGKYIRNEMRPQNLNVKVTKEWGHIQVFFVANDLIKTGEETSYYLRNYELSETSLSSCNSQRSCSLLDPNFRKFSPENKPRLGDIFNSTYNEKDDMSFKPVDPDDLYEDCFPKFFDSPDPKMPKLDE